MRDDVGPNDNRGAGFLPARRQTSVLDGELPRDHRDHAYCGRAFTCCVPRAVHDKLANSLKPKHGGDIRLAKEVLGTWYPHVADAQPADFVMPDAFKFWQAQFDRDFASRIDAGPKPSETGRTGAAAAGKYDELTVGKGVA